MVLLQLGARILEELRSQGFAQNLRFEWRYKLNIMGQCKPQERSKSKVLRSYSGKWFFALFVACYIMDRKSTESSYQLLKRKICVRTPFCHIMPISKHHSFVDSEWLALDPGPGSKKSPSTRRSGALLTACLLRQDPWDPVCLAMAWRRWHFLREVFPKMGLPSKSSSKSMIFHHKLMT